jgi:hypothetical protein
VHRTAENARKRAISYRKKLTSSHVFSGSLCAAFAYLSQRVVLLDFAVTQIVDKQTQAA